MEKIETNAGYTIKERFVVGDIGIVVGYRNAQGAIKVQCNRCRVVMVRKIKSRRHSTIDVYAPEGQEELEYVNAY